MKKCILLLWTAVLYIPIASGQLSEIDSMRALIPTVADTARIRLFISLTKKYQHTLVDSAEYFAQASIRESREIGYVEGEADGLNDLGLLRQYNGESAEALKLFFQSLELSQEINDIKRLGSAYNNIGIAYAMSEDYEKSLEFFTEMLEMYEEANFITGASYALNNIGLVHKEMGQDSTAKEYLTSALKLKEENADPMGIATGYANMADILKNMNYLDEALLYHFKADSALKALDNERGVILNKISMAELFILKGQTGKAKKYALESYEKAKRFGFRLPLLDILAIMVEISETNLDYKAALKLQKEYQILSDSIIKDKQSEALDKLKTKYEFEKKNIQIEQLRNGKLLDQSRSERQQFANYVLGISVGFMVLVVGLLSWAYINHRKKNRALALANKEKDQFISILSHDIRGPLNSLKGFSSLLVEDPGSLTKEDLDFFGNKINHSIDRLLKLVNNVLAWFFSKKSTDTLSLEKLDVSEQVEETMGLYSLMAYEKNIQLINETQPDTYCMADQNVLQTVLRNLLSNALKFSNHGSQIIFTSGKLTTKQVIVEVSDSGTGILKKDLPHLFEYSKKKVRVGTDSEVGSGLGLPLSKELIESSGGSLRAESTEGIGSKFSIMLPSAT